MPKRQVVRIYPAQYLPKPIPDTIATKSKSDLKNQPAKPSKTAKEPT